MLKKRFMIFGQILEIQAIMPCPVWRMPSSPLILAFCLSVAFASSSSLRAWMRKLPAAIKESSGVKYPFLEIKSTQYKKFAPNTLRLTY